MTAIRAIYRNGMLELLDPVNLSEGQAVEVQIVDERPSLVDTVAHLLVRSDTEPTLTPDEEAQIQQQLDIALQSQRPLSEIIIAERHEK